MKKQNQWIDQKYNSILKGKGFGISYNPDTNANPEGALWNGLGGLLGGLNDDGRAETALVKSGHCFILNGDFRKDYEKLLDKGYGACKKFYESKKAKHGSKWSN